MATTVEIDVAYPDGAPRGRQDVLIALVHGGAGGSTGSEVIGDTRRVRLDASGHASVELVANEHITPSGTYYRVSVDRAQPPVVRNIEVPDVGGVVSWSDPAVQILAPTPPDHVNVVTDVVESQGPAIAAAAVAALPELADGFASQVDDGTAGLVRVHHAPLVFPQKTTATSGTSVSTSLLTATLALPAAWTVNGNLFQLDLYGTINNNTGGNVNVTLSVRVGSTDVWTWAFTGLGASASDRPWRAAVSGVVAEIVPTVGLLVGTGVCTLGPPGGGAAAATHIAPQVVALFTPGQAVAMDVRVTHSSNSASLATQLAGGSRITLGTPG